MAGGEIAIRASLPLAYVTGLAATTSGVVVTGATASERRVVVGVADGSAGPIELPSGDDLVRDPVPLVTDDRVVVAWDEYEDDGSALVAQPIAWSGRGWVLEGGPARGGVAFAPAAAVAGLPDGLVEVRIEGSSMGAPQWMDADLRSRKVDAAGARSPPESPLRRSTTQASWPRPAGPMN